MHQAWCKRRPTCALLKKCNCKKMHIFSQQLHVYVPLQLAVEAKSNKINTFATGAPHQASCRCVFWRKNFSFHGNTQWCSHPQIMSLISLVWWHVPWKQHTQHVAKAMKTGFRRLHVCLRVTYYYWYISRLRHVSASSAFSYWLLSCRSGTGIWKRSSILIL